jgi:hypothetical protein
MLIHNVNPPIDPLHPYEHPFGPFWTQQENISQLIIILSQFAEPTPSPSPPPSRIREKGDCHLIDATQISATDINIEK